jgi:non-heme chloroperoxidase
LGGCSMGGAVSLATAIRSRVRLRGLVLMGTFGHCRHLPLWQRIGAPLSRIIPLRLSRRAARFVIGNTNHFGKVARDEADWLVSCKIDHTRDYFVRAIAALTKQNQIEDAKHLKVPTLVLHGTHDYVLPYAAGKELTKAIPGSRLVTIENSGHALFFTDHQPLNAAVLDFLQSLPPRAQN